MWLCKNYFGVQVGKSALIRNWADLKRQGILASVGDHGNYSSCRQVRWPFIDNSLWRYLVQRPNYNFLRIFIDVDRDPQIFENSDNSRPTAFNCQAYHNITPPPPKSHSCKSIHRLAFDLILYFHQNETTKTRNQIVSRTDTCVTVYKKGIEMVPHYRAEYNRLNRSSPTC